MKLTWKREGELFTRWQDTAIPASRHNAASDAPFVVEVYQVWRGYLLGWPVWKSRIVVGTLPVNQWIGRVTFGDPLLTPEQWETFNAPAIIRHNAIGHAPGANGKANE